MHLGVLNVKNSGFAEVTEVLQQIIPVIGRVAATVTHGSNTAQINLYVACGPGPNLLGRDCLRCLKLDWNFVFNATRESSNDFCCEFPVEFVECVAPIFPVLKATAKCASVVTTNAPLIRQPKLTSIRCPILRICMSSWQVVAGSPS